MGVVHAATDLKLNRAVALKLMLGELAHDPQFWARFRREVEILARLDAPHVLAILDHGELDGVPFLATQYVAGGDLGVLLAKRGPMPLSMAARVCAQVAEALAATHRAGVVHRDVKPSNVLLREQDPSTPHAYLCDFGIARSAGPTMTTAGAVSGTWTYLAPERMDGDPGSPASDIYSVGCLLFACLTGQPPYVGSDLQVAYGHREAPVPQFPGSSPAARHVNTILVRCLAKQPGQRYPTAAELARDLHAAADHPEDGFDPGATAGRVTGMPEVSRTRHGGRRRRLTVATGTVVLCLVAGGGWWAAAGDGPSDGMIAGPPASAGAAGVTGDLDEDDLGDVAAVVPGAPDGARRVVWHSDAERLVRGSSTRVDDYLDHVAADFDGDRRIDYAAVDVFTASARIRSEEGTETDKLKLPPAPKGVDDLTSEATFAGDFDGDGQADLGFAVEGKDSGVPNPITGEGMVRSCGLWILLRDEDGFAPAEQWAKQIPCFVPDLTVTDLGDDGRDDLVWLVDANTTWDGTVGQFARLVPLPSTGSSFERGDPVRVPESGPGGYVKPVSGDVDGDGADEVVAANRITRQHGDYDLDYLVYPDAEDGLAEPTQAVRTTRYSYELSNAMLVASDVNGDGRDDIVHATAPETFVESDAHPVRPGRDVNIDVVLVREDGSFASPTQWAVCQGCGSGFSLYTPVADYVSGQ